MMSESAIQQLIDAVREVVPDASHEEVIAAAALIYAQDAANLGVVAVHGARISRIVVWLRNNLPGLVP